MQLGKHLQNLGFHMTYRGQESWAYSGFFIAPMLVGLFLTKAWQFMPTGRHIKLLCLVSLGTATFGINRLVEHGWTGIAFILIALLSIIVVLSMTALVNRSRLAPVWLLLAILVSYGTALGPATTSVQNFNPSLWGLLAEIVPAYDSIRAVGRFGALGFSFALGLAWYLVNIQKCSKPSTYRVNLPRAVLLGVAALSAVVDVPRAPYCNRYDFSALSPTPSEKKFFDANPGRILILPINNLSLIPEHMLYFEQLAAVELVNGYSGKLSPLVEKLNSSKDMMDMQLVSHTMLESKPTHLLLDKRAFSSENRIKIATHFSGIVRMDNPRFQLLEIPPQFNTLQDSL